METTEKEAFIVDLYIRVSTDRQATEGDSLEEQESELKKFCEYRKFQIHHMFIERGKSAGNTNRPEYQKLIKDVKAKKINAVVVKKLDRLSRSLLDFEQLMTLLHENNVEFISLKESFDTTSAMGKAMLRVALVFAQLEREQTSERLVDVLDYRASQGLYNGGVPPYGYTNINKELIPYPREKQIVELIFDQFLENKSTTQTARFLNKTGYKYRNNKLWYDQLIQKVLQKSVYIGMVRWRNKEYQGIHQPIIATKRFNQVQEIFKNRCRLIGRSKTNAILQRLLFCGYCDSPMTTSFGINRYKTKYYYYRCTSTLKAEKKISDCTIKYIPFQTIEDQLTKLLLSLSETPAFLPLENQILKHNQAIEAATQEMRNQIQLLTMQQTELKTQKDRYLDSLITGQFNASERERINKRLDELDLEKKQLDAQLFKQQFELNQKLDDQINITQLKQLFITFKTDQALFTPVQLRLFFLSILDKILYHPDKLTLYFKLLPWPVSFETKVR